MAITERQKAMIKKRNKIRTQGRAAIAVRPKVAG